jgi:hypothetical protein
MGISTLSAALPPHSLVVSAPTARPVVAHSDSTHANEPPLLSAARQLVQLNCQFLELTTIARRFPDTIAIRLHAMSGEQRLAIAACHFSLFTLALNDANRWLPLLSGIAQTMPQDATLYRDATCAEFVSTALFFAWHLVQSDPLAAKVLLDIDAQVALALRRAPIASLRAVSNRALDWLAPRWLQHPYFWPALLRNSEDPTRYGLAATKLLGRQLLAAESLGSAGCLPQKRAAACLLMA